MLDDLARWKNDKDFWIEGDSSDYHVLYKAAQEIAINDISGLILEIGVRLGGSAFVTFKAFQDAQGGHYNRRFIGVDCYGSWAPSFTNEMKIAAKRNLFEYAWENHIDYTLLELEDTEFIERYADGVPTYNRTLWETKGKQYKPDDIEWKRTINEYSLVHLDGPHRMEDVVVETDFFEPRVVQGGIIVYDDVDKPKKYDHDVFEPTLLVRGWELIERTGSKASYRKL